jgi:hypothetical protein
VCGLQYCMLPCCCVYLSHCFVYLNYLLHVSLLYSKHSFYVLFVYDCFIRCMFCFRFCVFCVCVLFCVFSPYVYSCSFSIYVHVYGPLPSRGSPTAVSKNHRHRNWVMICGSADGNNQLNQILCVHLPKSKCCTFYFLFSGSTIIVNILYIYICARACVCVMEWQFFSSVRRYIF